MSAAECSKVVVLVTGCSKGGIGFALCEAFASKKGCIVYATARRIEAMRGFTQNNIRTLALDVTNDDNVREVVQTIVDAEGQIDILVNNAGISNTGALLDVDMQDILRVYDTNVFAVIRMAKAVIPYMASHQRGTIVNISSIDGEIPVPWGGAYCSSKAAVHSLTDTLYMECTPFNINVVLVAPGDIKSNIAANQEQRINLPPGSLYSDYVDSLLRKLNASQGNPTPAHKFARGVVSAIMAARPPRYLRLGAMPMVYRFLNWLPRGWILRHFWETKAEVPRRAALKTK
ncbi:oxidoreductase [Earliella scabrosa]|nr:oxidoreductase [Earliella scabrosa]